MDQSTTDATKQIVESLAEKYENRCPVHYHHLEKAGLSRAYNAGVSVSDGAVIACTDDDVIVPSGWLAAIARTFEVDPEVGLIYGQVLVPEALKGDVADGLIVPSLEWDQRQRLSQVDRNFKVWGMGANMAVRRSVFEDVGGFDEAMGGGAPLRSSQDFDFSFRTYRSGHAIVLDPEVTVDHYGSRTLDQWPLTESNYAIGNGAFYWKHVRCGDLLAVRWLVTAMVRVVGRMVFRSYHERRPVGVNAYGKNLLKGVLEASRFDIDRSRRLFKESARAQLSVTAANAVTTAVPDRG
jgi:GT2 family glycosyltransferase